VQHDDGPGSLYDIHGESGAIVDRVAPREDEPIVVKNYLNSFVQTELEDRLKSLGAENVVLAGFMTHMCVNSTARGAFNLGYAPTVVASATATRALPGVDGTVVAASALQSARLAAVADLFAIVVPDSAALT
jgi:nicotinamidase-related amidase